MVVLGLRDVPLDMRRETKQVQGRAPQADTHVGTRQELGAQRLPLSDFPLSTTLLLQHCFSVYAAFM